MGQLQNQFQQAMGAYSGGQQGQGRQRQPMPSQQQGLGRGFAPQQPQSRGGGMQMQPPTQQGGSGAYSGMPQPQPQGGPTRMPPIQNDRTPIQGGTGGMQRANEPWKEFEPQRGIDQMPGRGGVRLPPIQYGGVKPQPAPVDTAPVAGGAPVASTEPPVQAPVPEVTAQGQAGVASNVSSPIQQGGYGHRRNPYRKQPPPGGGGPQVQNYGGGMGPDLGPNYAY